MADKSKKLNIKKPQVSITSGTDLDNITKTVKDQIFDFNASEWQGTGMTYRKHSDLLPPTFARVFSDGQDFSVAMPIPYVYPINNYLRKIADYMISQSESNDSGEDDGGEDSEGEDRMAVARNHKTTSSLDRGVDHSDLGFDWPDMDFPDIDFPDIDFPDSGGGDAGDDSGSGSISYGGALSVEFEAAGKNSDSDCDLSPPYIMWEPCLPSSGRSGDIKDEIWSGIMGKIEKQATEGQDDNEDNDDDDDDNEEAKWINWDLSQVSEYSGEATPDDYIGPKFYQYIQRNEPPPNTLNNLLGDIDDKRVGLLTNLLPLSYMKSLTNFVNDTSANQYYASNYAVTQGVNKAGIWWGLQSSSFLSRDMPFWVLFKNTKPENTKNRETMLVLSFGHADVNNRFDIVLPYQGTPFMIDYYKYTAKENDQEEQSGEDVNGKTITFNDFPTITLDEEEANKVGVIAVSGALIVLINDHYYIHRRLHPETGDFISCKIPSGGIRVFGTNVKTTVMASPMVFAPFSILTKELPYFMSGRTLEYGNVTHEMTKGDDGPHMIPLTHTNDEGEGGILWQQPGVYCRKFRYGSIDGDWNDYRVNNKTGGVVAFYPTDVLNSKGGEGEDPMKHYVLLMISNPLVVKQGGSEAVIPYGTAPVFSRLYGIDEFEFKDPSPSYRDISEHVMSVTESFDNDGYHTISKTLNIRLYNEGGKFNYLRFEQRGVRLSWGGDKSFTGIITNTSNTETPGQEVLDLSCQDYMYVLEHRPILNSPIYDGMFAISALIDLAEKAGVVKTERDWQQEWDYFLKSGYVFTEPKMRFDKSKMIKECMEEILKKWEMTMHFDEDGVLQFERLPGGLFSVNGAGSVVADFYTDMLDDNVLLDELKYDVSVADTYNKITVMGVSRENRLPLIATLPAEENNDRLGFIKIAYLRRPYMSDIESVEEYAEELSRRLFNPLRTISFRTAGEIYSDSLQPFDFINVNDRVFRLMSLKRSYDASTNSLVQDFEGEWMGAGNW